MKKRMLSWGLMLSLLITLLPVRVLAAGGTCNGSHSGWTALSAGTTSLSGNCYLSDHATASGSITISGAATLCLNGKVLDLNGYNITVGSGGSLTICDCQTTATEGCLDETGLWQQGSGGESCLLEGGVITGGQATLGGAILVEGGALTLESGNIAGSTADKGGGVYVSNGSFTMTGGTITGNLANGVGAGTSGADICGGGGVYVSTGGTFSMSGGSIQKNRMTVSEQNDGGGGVLIDDGSFTLSGGSITGNAAVKQSRDGSGGGVYLSRGTFTMSGGAISGNEAASGGGVLVFGKKGTETNFLLSGGSITGNHASENGGGVYLSSSSYEAAFELSGEPDISRNTAGSNSAPSNLYLNNNVITLNELLPPGKAYGVNATRGFVTRGWGTHMSGAEPTDYFTSEMDGAIIMLAVEGDSQEVILHTHFYSYTTDGQANTITQTCTGLGNCGHSATATLSVSPGPHYANADGSPVTPATVTYSSNWVGEQPEVDYENNTSVGIATASLTIENKTVSINFTIEQPLPTFTVTFNANGHGTAPEQQSVQQDGKVEETPTPTADGYDFGGWYRDADCTTLWNFGSDTVSGDLTLYAKWTLITYHITYDLDGGSLAGEQVNPGSYTVETGDFILNNPTKQGYLFTGWTQGGGTVLQQTVTIPRGSTGDKTYTAHWTLSAPTVTLSADPADASGTYSGGSPVVTLTAQASHEVGVTDTYAWYKDGQLLDGKTDRTLALTDVAHSGTYTAAVTVRDAGGQQAVGTSNPVKVTIRGATPDYTVPTGLTAAYGDKLSSVALPEGWAWEDGDALVGSAGERSHAAIFTPADPDNYETVQQMVTVMVSKVTLTPAVTSVESKEYDGSAETEGTISLTGAVAGDQPTATGTFTFEDAGAGEDKTVHVTVTLDGTWGENYVLSTAELTATADITPKTVGLVWHGYENLVYTGQPVSVTAEATGLVGQDSCTVTVEGGDKVDVGTYTAEATGLDNPNYQLPADGTTLEYTIAQAAGTASVTMAGWTYGETAAAPVPASATHGTDHVTCRYTGTTAGGATYDSSAVPTDAGSYTVTATFAATDNYDAVTAQAQFTVARKTLSAVWLGLDQVYGDKTKVEVTLSGVVSGDDIAVSITGVAQAAGSYPLTAALTGDDVSNYTLKNGAATLTIQAKPVIFTVAGNTVQADGSEKKASVTADDESCPYTVTYRQNGSPVSSPKDVGSYEIWVTITDPNYRHTNGSTGMQVGTLTITQAPPVVYTATFAAGESAGGVPPAAQTAVKDSQIILPANPFAWEGHLFTGWKADGGTTLYQPGETFTMPARNVAFTAQWQAVFDVTGTVTEETESGNIKAANAVVSLWLGSNKLGEVTTKSDGTFEFKNLVPGIYNLVVTKDVRTVTHKVVITTESKTCNAVLPQGATNSVVKVTPGSPDIVVGDLEKVFTQPGGDVYTAADAQTVKDGGKVEITFLADEKQQGDPTIAGDMEKITAKMDDSVTVGLVMDYTLEKTVTQPDGTTDKPTPIPQANVLLEVLLPLPAELQGKQSYSVYRVHDGTAQVLTTTPSADLGEYFTVSSDSTGLILYVKCFSTYAIGYTESAGNSGNGSGGSSSGGGSSKPAYPPKVEQPEHGSVTTSPNNPQKGDKVTITPAPGEGYTVDEVNVTGPDGKAVTVTPNGDGTYTFVQPGGKVTINVTFRPIDDTSGCPRDERCPMADYSDTDRNAWYHDGVHYCLETGLMVGTGETTFAPDTATTRGMLVTILWRLEGSPVVSNSTHYGDVVPGAWYEQAVRWATSTGVVTGYDNGSFGPDDPITREQLALILWRYAGSPEAGGSLSAFADGAQTNSWAQSAMLWAVEQGLITGVGNDRLDPQGQATRAEAAAILMRLAQSMAQ